MSVSTGVQPVDEPDWVSISVCDVSRQPGIVPVLKLHQFLSVLSVQQTFTFIKAEARKYNVDCCYFSEDRLKR